MELQACRERVRSASLDRRKRRKRQQFRVVSWYLSHLGGMSLIWCRQA